MITAFLDTLSIIRVLLQRSKTLNPPAKYSKGHRNYLHKLRAGVRVVMSNQQLAPSQITRRSEAAAVQVQRALGNVVLSVESEAEKPPMWQQGDMELNTASVFEARVKLRQHPMVRSALQTFWVAILRSMESSAHQSNSDGVAMKHGNEAADDLTWTELPFEGYHCLLSRVYRVLVDGIETSFDLEAAILDDWAHDLPPGSERLCRETCVDALFELADMWTQGVSAEEYSAFLVGLLNRVCITETVPDGKPTKYIWRSLGDCCFDESLCAGGMVGIDDFHASEAGASGRVAGARSSASDNSGEARSKVGVAPGNRQQVLQTLSQKGLIAGDQSSDGQSIPHPSLRKKRLSMHEKKMRALVKLQAGARMLRAKVSRAPSAV